jgi:predicted RecB family nuclease
MTITPQLFESHLKCPTKCWLRFVGDTPAGNTYAEWLEIQTESYRAAAAARLSANLPADECEPSLRSSRREEAHYFSAENLKTAKWRLALDVPVRIEIRSSRGNEAQTEKSDIVKLKSEMSQSLLTSAATRDGVEEPKIGKAATLGQAQPRVTKVKTSALAGEVRKRLDKITALLSNSTPPDLVLNRHCAECEFQARCRKIAIETDDLSLLAGMSAKERQQLRSKGIFTVTQLSYTFRPRRWSKRLRDKREKYHHALKALAIREKKILTVGSPELKIEGTPVYLDVEGLPWNEQLHALRLILRVDSNSRTAPGTGSIREAGSTGHTFPKFSE